ncbi:hypothetical protein BDF20DRAFT_671134 [Mycotypha africana]|uniref:uncharacterized protein n=1 Tax=Mycotypha africana TaxID=64632 RepID=UPI002301CEFC|nr:uncharacterized protein BDF20DRAFT_671134 [Mycotypha africana]KAI8973750.1 hypothetical protein BDF20DRAFT_671134 [Mycotypha africana]
MGGMYISVFFLFLPQRKKSLDPNEETLASPVFSLFKLFFFFKKQQQSRNSMLAGDKRTSYCFDQLKDKFAEVYPPATDDELQSLIVNLEASNEGLAIGIPDDLSSLWRISSEWHLIKDHYNVFGFNIYSPQQVIPVTNDIFGGSEDVRQEWVMMSGQEQESCGSAGWMCIASYSEYDYIFMNFNKRSRMFGTTRHMVNNTNEDNALTNPPFSNFIEYVLDFVEGYQQE